MSSMKINASTALLQTIDDRNIDFSKKLEQYVTSSLGNVSCFIPGKLRVSSAPIHATNGANILIEIKLMHITNHDPALVGVVRDISNFAAGLVNIPSVNCETELSIGNREYYGISGENGAD